MTEADSTRIELWLDAMATEAKELLGASLADTRIIGIRTGGVTIAHALHERLKCDAPVGELNINFYRDDFSRTGMHPVVGPSSLPSQIDGQPVLLVDDVLFSGRTIRAALNEIFDYGRPASVRLAVLVARSGRELPIQPDVTGCVMDVPDTEQIKLLTDPLALRRQSTTT